MILDLPYSGLHLSAVDLRHDFTTGVICNLQKCCNLYDMLKSTEEQSICSAKHQFLTQVWFPEIPITTLDTG